MNMEIYVNKADLDQFDNGLPRIRVEGSATLSDPVFEEKGDRIVCEVTPPSKGVASVGAFFAEADGGGHTWWDVRTFAKVDLLPELVASRASLSG